MKSWQKETGSRNLDGNVPNANWNDDKLNVNWYNSDNANDNLRSRQEVSEKSHFYNGIFNKMISNILSNR